MRILICCLLLIVNTRLAAQDYLVTARQDTLRGKISINSFPNLDKVTVAVDRKNKSDYNAYNVLLLYIDSTVYKPVRTTDAYRFMRVAKTGLVSLVYAQQAPGTPYNIPYVVKTSGQSMEVTAIRFKKSMSQFLSECSSLKTKIEEDQLGRKDLEKIVDQYNNCLEQQTNKAFSASEDPKIAAVNAFHEKLHADATVPVDAMDILKDLYGKVKEGKTVPNYLFEGLRDALKGHPAYQADLEELIARLKE